MNFTILPQSLWPAAEAAAEYFRREWGIRTLSTEEAIDDAIGYRTTLLGQTDDFYYLCIEVSDMAYPPSLDSFVLDCKNRCLPVKLFVAVSKSSNDPRYKDNIRRARMNGVGLIELDLESGTGQIVQPALALSLTGIRVTDRKLFPQKYRGSLARAEETFRQGTPDKACSLVYDEIEDLTRRIAMKTARLSYWRTPLGKGRNLKTEPWAKIAKLLEDSLQKKGAAQHLTGALLARVRGITSYRNSSGHKPGSSKELLKRDSALRTRFESAIDLLRELIDASKPLRL